MVRLLQGLQSIHFLLNLALAIFSIILELFIQIIIVNGKLIYFLSHFSFVYRILLFQLLQIFRFLSVLTFRFTESILTLLEICLSSVQCIYNILGISFSLFDKRIKIFYILFKLFDLKNLFLFCLSLILIDFAQLVFKVVNISSNFIKIGRKFILLF